MFKHSFIPRNLDEVIDFERDVIMAKEGQTEGVCEVLCIQRNCNIKIRTKLSVSVDWISCKFFKKYYNTELTYNLCPCLIRQRFFTCIKFSFYLWFQLPVCITDRKNIYIFIFILNKSYLFFHPGSTFNSELLLFCAFQMLYHTLTGLQENLEGVRTVSYLPLSVFSIFTDILNQSD